MPQPTGPSTIFQVAGGAMSAQLVRLNTAASNLANAGSISSSAETAYRPIKPVFRTQGGPSGMAGVRVERVVATDVSATRRHDPGHPLADANGDVWVSPVDETQELVEMMEGARQYSNLVEVVQTAKSLTLETLKVGR